MNGKSYSFSGCFGVKHWCRRPNQVLYIISYDTAAALKSNVACSEPILSRDSYAVLIRQNVSGLISAGRSEMRLAGGHFVRTSYGLYMYTTSPFMFSFCLTVGSGHHYSVPASRPACLSPHRALPAAPPACSSSKLAQVVLIAAAKLHRE